MLRNCKNNWIIAKKYRLFYSKTESKTENPISRQSTVKKMMNYNQEKKYPWNIVVNIFQVFLTCHIRHYIKEECCTKVLKTVDRKLYENRNSVYLLFYLKQQIRETATFISIYINAIDFYVSDLLLFENNITLEK